MAFFDRALAKPSIAAGVGAIAITQALPAGVESVNVPFTKQTVPTWVGGAALGVIGSWTADLVHEITHGITKKNQALDDIGSLATVVGSNAAVWYLIPSYMGIDSSEAVQLAIAGGVSEMIARAVWERYLSEGVQSIF